MPRRLAGWERAVINGAWRSWLPLFSLLYRLQNYWDIGRIAPYLPTTARVSRLRLAAAGQALSYLALVVWLGPVEVLVLCGPGLLLALMGQDLLLLSQQYIFSARFSLFNFAPNIAAYFYKLFSAYFGMYRYGRRQ